MYNMEIRKYVELNVTSIAKIENNFIRYKWQYRNIILAFLVITVALLNGCLGTLSLSQNVRPDILSNFDQKGEISSLYDNIVEVPDTLILVYLKTDGTEYISSDKKFLHNIKPSFERIFQEYMSTKFNTLKKSANQLKLSIVLSNYTISSRDISAKGEKFMAVFAGSADLRSEYCASLQCRVNIEYKGETYEKEFFIKENDQNLTQLRTNTISSYNAYSGNTKTSYSTSSSSNPVQDGISNCLNNANTRVLLNLDKLINDVLSSSTTSDAVAKDNNVNPPQEIQMEQDTIIMNEETPAADEK